MQKTVVFDFDRTLSKKDTNLAFFYFFAKKQKYGSLKLIIYFLYKIIQKFRVISNESLKNIGLSLFVRPLTYENYLELCKLFAKDIEINKEVNKRYDEYCLANENVIILTASIKEYVEFLFPEAKVLGSEIIFNEKGTYLSFHCYGENKLYALNKNNIFQIDDVYTDSLSDLPLVRISKKIFLVKSGIIYTCRSTSDFINKIKNRE